MKSLFYWLNITIPLIAGAVIYYLISPEVIFVRQMDALLGGGFHPEIFSTGNWAACLCRNYLMDFLWGYSLIFSLFYITGKNTAGLRGILAVAVLFSAGMELLQLTPLAHGTFDTWDIIVEMTAETAAVLIIKRHMIGGRSV